jgi:GxxExxY protein
MKHEEITKTIIGCAFDVMKELGSGFLESVYAKAMRVAIEHKGLRVQSQHPIKVNFRGECVGDFFADLLVEDVILVELKAVKAIAPEHQAQIINYLIATGIDVGLLINFGSPKLEYKRFTRNKNIDKGDELNKPVQNSSDQSSPPMTIHAPSHPSRSSAEN